MTWRCRDFRLALDRTLTMGIVNVTPDSFSDGGRYYRPEEAVRRVRNCFAEGADLVDLGGESTRPDATPIGWEEEWRRLAPVLAALDPAHQPLSVDTYHPETAERALAAGVAVINCVKAGSAAAMCALAARTPCGLVLPCRLTEGGEPAPALPFEAFNAGDDVRLLVDPLIGFGTTRDEDLALLGGLRRLARHAPVLAGVSRKRLVKKLTGAKAGGGAGKDLGGCLGAAVWCAMAGAAVVRVHDVRETVQALRVVTALAAAEREATA